MQPETVSRKESMSTPPRGRRRATVSALLVEVLSTMMVLMGAGCRKASPAAFGLPSGGGEYVLDYNVFAGQIDPILTRLGCDDRSCHAGESGGTFALSPFDGKDVSFDYDQACKQVYPPDPSLSALVMKPLDPACGGPGHGGGSFFRSLDDPDYLAILTWIEAGEYR